MKRPHDIILEEEKRHQEQEIRRIYRLSRCSVGLAATLGFLFPIGAYLYTRRWKALGAFFLFAMILSLLVPRDDSEEFSPSMAEVFLIGIVAAVDNTRAIQWAKEQIESNLNQE